MNVQTEFASALITTYPSPLVSRERFAEMLFGNRDSVGIVIGMINKGYLPTVSIGKYSFVNIAILQKKCLDKEFTL